MKKLAIIAIAAVAAAANANVYSNGPVSDGVNASNQPISKLISPASIFGFGGQIAANNWMADDFTVTGPGWKVTRLSFFAYQTGATGFTFNAANVGIVTGGDPNAGTSMLSLSNAAVTNGGLAAYRVSSTTPDVTNRPMFRVDVATNVILNAGVHSLKWSLGGTLASGPWFAPVAPFTAGNATQSLNGGAFTAALDAGLGLQAELPFEVEYTVVPEPATMIALGAGIAAVAARRRRK